MCSAVSKRGTATRRSAKARCRSGARAPVPAPPRPRCAPPRGRSALRAGGGRIQQLIRGAARQPPGKAQDDGRDRERGQRICIAQPANAESHARIGGGQPHGDRNAGPDVGGEVKRVGFQRLRAGRYRDMLESARTAEIDGDRKCEYRKGPHRRTNGTGATKMRMIASTTIQTQEAPMRKVSVKAERVSTRA